MEVDLTPQDLETTPEFQSWKEAKIAECVRYLKLSFNEDVTPDKLILKLLEEGYPDPVLQLQTHARIWGYNYKNKDGEIAVNPANGKLMTFAVWKVLENKPPEPVETEVETEVVVETE